MLHLCGQAVVRLLSAMHPDRDHSMHLDYLSCFKIVSHFLGVLSNIAQVLLPVWYTKVSRINLLVYFRLHFCIICVSYVVFSLHLSTQSERWGGCAALYFCSNWPWGMSTLWLLPSHQQHTYLPLHSKVHFNMC